MGTGNDRKKEIISTGDFNLNYLRWEVSQNTMNSYDRQKKKPLIDIFKSQIIEKGHMILSNTPTKMSENADI